MGDGFAKSNPQTRLEGLRTIWGCSQLRSLVVHTREEGLRWTGMDLNNLKNPCAFHAQKDFCLRENHPKSGRWKSVRANLRDRSGWVGSSVGMRVGWGAKLLFGKYHPSSEIRMGDVTVVSGTLSISGGSLVVPFRVFSTSHNPTWKL